MKAMAPILQSEELDDCLRQIESAFERKFDQFHTAEGNWSYYMLQPRVIIPPHYMIFEVKLLGAATFLSGRESFLKEYRYREDCLRDHLQAEFRERADGLEYYLLRACSPHHYLIDVNGTIVEFYDEDGNVIWKDQKLKFEEWEGDRELFRSELFVHGLIPSDLKPVRYRVYSQIAALDYPIFDSLIMTSAASEKKLNWTLDVAYDAEKDYKTAAKTKGTPIRFVPEKTSKEEGRLIYIPSEPAKTGKGIWVMEVYNRSERDLSIALILGDTTGHTATRYYTKLRPGGNCIAFDETGFEGFEELKDISSLCLRVFDSDLEVNETLLEAGELYCFETLEGYYDYIMNSNYLINPQ
jgi:hypothetical protein